MELQITWFLLIGVLITGYAILDGFDLGVGILHLFAKNDTERRIHLNAIGPVWDGNEVWLLTAGGAIFAAFPPVYATVFSGLYLAFMLVLLALIFRAVSMEFRSKLESAGWRRCWDWAFGLGSLLATILFGAAIGNIIKGLPINADGVIHISFFALLSPYALVLALLTVAMFAMHGALYMTLKSEGELQQRMSRWAGIAWVVFLVLYIVATAGTVLTSPFMFEGVFTNVLWWIAVALMLASVTYIPLANKAGKYLHAFLSSAAAIASLIALMGIGLFPRMVPSSMNPDWSLTIYQHSSTPLTLKTMLIIALIGVPLMLIYTSFVYRAFGGKVKITKDSY